MEGPDKDYILLNFFPQLRAYLTFKEKMTDSFRPVADLYKPQKGTLSQLHPMKSLVKIQNVIKNFMLEDSCC